MFKVYLLIWLFIFDALALRSSGDACREVSLRTLQKTLRSLR